ncbi:hypothetical protein KY284_011500 [Solanum tuberosum]|nr:hypothetical protein KY284_011500 [Solanum tuberosum]
MAPSQSHKDGLTTTSRCFCCCACTGVRGMGGRRHINWIGITGARDWTGFAAYWFGFDFLGLFAIPLAEEEEHAYGSGSGIVLVL